MGHANRSQDDQRIDSSVSLSSASALLLILLLAGCAAEPSSPSNPSAQENVERVAPLPLPEPQVVDVSGLVATFTRSSALAASGVRPHPLSRVRWFLRAGQRSRAVAALDYGAGSYSDDEDIGRYLLAKTLIAEGEPRGYGMMKELSLVEGAERLRYGWLARGAFLAGSHEEGVAATRELAERSPGDHRLPELWLIASRGADDPEVALSLLREADGLKMSRATEAKILSQKVRLQEEDNPEGARKAAMRLLLRFPEQPEASPDLLPLSLDELSEEQRFSRAKRLMKRWAYEEAREEFSRFLEDKKRRVDAHWYLGIIGLRKLRDDPLGARAHFQTVYDAGKRREDALYNIFRSHMRLEEYDQALEVGERYLKKFPKGEYASRISYYRGWLPYDHRETQEAIPALRRHFDRYGYKRSETMGFWAWSYLRLEDWEGANEAFGKLAERYGNTVVRGKAWYWQAFALRALSREEEALEALAKLHAKYPLSYYDMLGLQLEASIKGEDMKASALAWPEGGGLAANAFSLDEELWTWPRVSGRTKKAFQRVQRLIELDEIDAARSEWRPIRDKVVGSVKEGKRLHFVYFMGHQVEDYAHGRSLIDDGLSRPGMADPEDIRWLIAYPEAYKPLVEALADEFELHPALIYAIMRQESRYRPHQISGADAVGALQMIPSTAKKIAEELGFPYDAEAFPEPQEGFRYSAYYLKKHLDLWNGQVVPTAASYNGGPEPIGRWIRANPGVSMAILIEEFAYNESRIYCRKVAEHMLRYLYLYEPDPLVRARWLDALFPVIFDGEIPDDVGY